jgi:uncharacterized membrane protein YjfL (UPF0719 family)
MYMLKSEGFSGRESEFKTGDKLVFENNKAVAISFSGYIVGLAMIFVSAIEDLDQGEGITTLKYGLKNTTQSFPDWSHDEWMDQQGENVWQTIVWTSMGLVMLLISRILNDVMTCDLNEAVEIAKHENLAAAIMESASYICCGLVASGAISGRPTEWGTDVATTWIYFGIGQFLYMATVKKFQISCLRKWDVVELVKDGNTAAAVAVGCETLSMAIIIFSSVYLSTSLAIFGFSIAVAGLAAVLARLMADHLILPKSPIANEISKDRNWGAAMVCGSAQIASSMMIMALPASSCDDLSSGFSDSLTDTDKFSRIFEWYQLFLLLLIPIFILSVRWLYPLGLSLSGGVPDLDFLRDGHDGKKNAKPPLTIKDDDTGPMAAKDEIDNAAGSEPEASRGSGSGVEAGVAIEVDDVTPQVGGGDFEKACKQGMANYDAELKVEGYSDEIDVDKLLTHHDNKSIAISFSGYVIGVALLFRGTVSATIYDFPTTYDFDDQMKDLCPTIMLLVLGLFCMLLCHIINDKVILPGMKNIAALDGRHMSPAVGIVEAGSFIATGQILGASSYGYVDVDDSDSWGEAIFFQFFWFVVGQLTIIIMSCLSDSIYGKAKEGVKKGKLSSGIFLSMRLITAGAMVSAPIGKSDSVVTYCAMLPLVYILCQIGKYMFRLSLACGSLFEGDNEAENDEANETVQLTTWQIVIEGLPFKKNKNWGNALLEGFVFLALANIFGAFLRSCDCYTQYLVNLL